MCRRTSASLASRVKDAPVPKCPNRVLNRLWARFSALVIVLRISLLCRMGRLSHLARKWNCPYNVHRILTAPHIPP